MCHARILPALAGVLVAFAGCTREPAAPAVFDPGGGGLEWLIASPPIAEIEIVEAGHWKVVTVEPERRGGVVGEPIGLRVTVRDRAGVLLKGEDVTLESSVEDDSLTPEGGATDEHGVLEAALIGTTAGMRTVVARVGDSKGRASLWFTPARCENGMRVGGFGPVDQVWRPGSRVELKTADFDGDGACELAMFGPATGLAASENPGRDLIIRSASNRSWPRIEPPGGRMSDVAMGDFDGDGIDDVAAAVVTGAGTRIDWLVSGGDGSWTPAATIDLPGRDLFSMTAADVDGDGRIDLLVEHTSEGKAGDGDHVLQVLFSGVGGELRPSESALPLERFARWVAGDFDGDGKADLAIQGPTRTVSIMKGVGDGSFESSTSYTSQAKLHVALDVDRDGFVDIVGFTDPREGPPFVEIARGRGDLRLETTNFVPGGSPRAVATGDYDGDGLPDLFLVSSDFGGSVLSVALGREEGWFAHQTLDSALPFDGVGGFAVCNHEGRDRPEIIVLSNGALLILPIEESWADLPSTVYPRYFPGVDAVAVGDLGNDGVVEVASLYSWGTVEVFHFDGGRFVQNVSEISTEIGRARSIALADLDGDPIGTVLVAQPFGEREELWIHPLSLGQPRRLVVAKRILATTAVDIDGDGRPDIALCTPDATAVLYAKGDGSYRPEQVAPEGCHAIASGDVDGDGFADLAVLGDRGLTLLRGDPRLGFRVEGFADIFGSTLAISDLDADGKGEVIVGGDGEVIVAAGSAAGALPDVTRLATGGGAIGSIATGDFDYDGLVDVAAIGEDPAIVIFLRSEAGGFLRALRFGLGLTPYRGAIGFLAETGGLALTIVDQLGIAQAVPFCAFDPAIPE